MGRPSFEAQRAPLVEKYRDRILKDGWGRYKIAGDAKISEKQARLIVDAVIADSERKIPVSNANDADPEAVVRAALLRSKDVPVSLTDLANEADCSPRRIEEVLTQIQSEGHNVVRTGDVVVIPKHGLPSNKRVVIEETGEMRRFALISCTHGGSAHEQLEALHSFYEILRQQGVEHAFHAGDITHGLNVYKGQYADLKAHSYEEQAKHAATTYPHNGLTTTRFITGNHDEDAIKHRSADPGLRVEAIRRQLCAEQGLEMDMEYMGMYSAFVNVGGLKVQLQHGGGGVAYARSYKLQKMMESLPRFGPEQYAEKHPHIFALGHYHQSVYLPDYQRVETFMLGAFEGRNNLCKRFGLFGRPAGWIIEVRIVGGEIRSIKPELYQFPLEDVEGTQTIYFDGSTRRPVIQRAA